MSSGYSPWWKRKILYKIPGLYKLGPCYNYHPFWDRLCFCRCHEHIGSDWHGGIYDFKRDAEYQFCKYCEQQKENAQ